MSLEMIFIHIPKTGGVSFAELVRCVYGEEYNAYTPLHIRPETDELLYINYAARKASWNLAMKKIPAEVRWLTDHMPVQLFDGLFPGVPRVTWLRDPVQRVISDYIWDLTHGYIESIAPREYIHRPRHRNLMTFFTGGGDLSRFAFVGICERLHLDSIRLGKLLHWPSIAPVGHVNTTPSPKMKARLLSDEALLKEIEGLNKLDREVYEEAKGR